IARVTTGKAVIKIIHSRADSAIYPISHFWSTLVINFISADSFGCTYPSLT
ncbi:hypothetical protein BKA93DRAFT_698635, partial [Sparassis latifolia]